MEGWREATWFTHNTIQVWKMHKINRNKAPSVAKECTCAASYVMVLVSVCTMGTSLVAISVFWAANVSEIVTISVFTTGGWGGRRERSEGRDVG